MSGRAWASPASADERSHPPALVFEAGERNHHISNTAYPIAHSTTWKPYRVPRENHAELVRRAFDGINDLCLYAHIPFCEVRCSYCEYTVVGKDELSQTAEYMDLLGRELALYRGLLGTEARTLHGFDIGGGTPSFVEAGRIAELVARVRECFRFASGAGISIETTPRIAAAEQAKLETYARAGIERISMGVQVIQPDLLKVLNRAGNGIEHHQRAVENIRRAGFRKFNIDLMDGFADQSLESWRATLEHAIRLDPEYITLYRMRYKLTRISDQAPRVTLDQVRAQAELSKQLLKDAGYLANPGKNTYSSIPGDTGTSDYLTRRVVDGMTYLGLGLGAQSFTDTTISYNDGAAGKNLAPYRRSLEMERLPIQDLYDLPLAHMMAKMAAVSFYFGEIDRRAFQEKFERAIEEAFPAEVEFVLARGLMREMTREIMRDTGRALSLTPEGARHFNGVIALFFAPSVQEYLIRRDPDTAGDMQRNRQFALAVAKTGPKLEAAASRPSRVDFANILFSGPCNRFCPFCIGKLMPDRVNGNSLDLFPPANIDAFIVEVNRLGIRQIVFTGTTTDPQLYRHEAALLDLLRGRIQTGAQYSVHTNGVLALKKLDVFNLYDKACISFPSFVPGTYEKMMGSRRVPDLEGILAASRIPVKVSCVVNEHNAAEIDRFLVRCRAIGVRRLVLRKLFGETRDWPILHGLPVAGHYRNNPVYNLDGMEVTYWDFDQSSSSSINLFSDGTLGSSYLLAHTRELKPNGTLINADQRRPEYAHRVHAG